MCLVIDANKAADLARQEKPYLRCLMAWINGGGKVVSGGHLERELMKIAAMRGLLGEWSRRGNLIQLRKEEVDKHAADIASDCQSDDPHVVALAVLGRADVVVTEDRRLIEDLRDRRLVGHRRRIFKENSASPARIDRHVQLLLSLDCPR